MTLEFFEKSERVTLKGTDVSATDQTNDIFVSILISSSSKENLELMISKIVQIKKSTQNNDSNKKIESKKSVLPAKTSQKKRLVHNTEEN